MRTVFASRPDWCRRWHAALALLALLVVAPACYGFSGGGGLPEGLRTVAVLPFDNRTIEPILTQEMVEAVRAAVVGRLGLRQAGEAQADVIVRGTILRYEPDLPVAVTGVGTPGQQPGQGQINVSRRLVQITLNLELVNQQTGKVLWQAQGRAIQGDYPPGQEIQGRQRAYERLQIDIVEGMQSQW